MFLTTLIAFRKCLTVHEIKFMIHDAPSFVFCSCFIFETKSVETMEIFGTEWV
jgi:hypothetical protein